MDEKIVLQVCSTFLSQKPERIMRCGVGLANYVYLVKCKDDSYIFRFSEEHGAYDNTVHWLEKLAELDIPVSEVIGKGRFEEYEFLILSYLEGEDIGLVYTQLQDEDKRAIAKEIVHIQNKAAALEPDNVDENWSWAEYISGILESAERYIAENGYFDAEKAERLRSEMKKLDKYFANIKPVAYLDDISSKNLLVHNGRISGIIDVDEIGIGDKLTYTALTNMALLDMGCDTDYVKYILEEMQITDTEKKAFLFYTLMYCAVFMGERGTTFLNRTVEVNERIIDKLNGIYERLWDEWNEAW